MKVRFTGSTSMQALVVLRDLTKGKVYEATPIANGATDPYGFTVDCDDGIIIKSDDVGDLVAARLNSGFEVVEE